MSDEPLHIRRPIPRRPFEIGVLSPTPPDTDSPPQSPRLYTDDEDRAGQTYLDPQAFNRPVDSSSRADSYRVLTSSTLSGIYSPNVSGYPASEAAEEDVSGTPVPEILDESIYKLVRDRSSVLRRRRSSALSGRSGQGMLSASPLSLTWRTGLLFLLGMGYGALLSRLSNEQKWASFPVDGILSPGYDGRYLAAWGLCGVVLGSLLPWFDGKWEQAFERTDDDDFEEAVKDEEGPGTDWALVVRGIGAFAGIVFAIVSLGPQNHSPLQSHPLD